MEIKKIVKCTPDQYKELLANGQILVNGELETLEDETLYDTGYIEFIEWYNKFMEAQYKKYEVLHSPVTMKSLKQEYLDIIGRDFNEDVDDDTDSANVSSVGYSAILKKGDTIKVTEPNYATFYINGEIRTIDYTCNSDGYEIVNVWCFVDEFNRLELNDTPAFNINELYIANRVHLPKVSKGYTDHALILNLYCFPVGGVSTRKLIDTGTTVFSQKTIANGIGEIVSMATMYDADSTGITAPINKTNLKKFDMPELDTIVCQNSAAFLNGCSNDSLVYNLPKLRTIRGYKSNAAKSAPFYLVKNVVIPKSVKSTTGLLCTDNQTIVLECNEANFDSIWCYNTPSINFEMCGNWKGNIDLHKAAANKDLAWFEDLFRNKLATVAVGSKSITIPVAIFDAMLDKEDCAVDIAEAKGWEVGGH